MNGDRHGCIELERDVGRHRAGAKNGHAQANSAGLAVGVRRLIERMRDGQRLGEQQPNGKRGAQPRSPRGATESS
jgi:hypothetical protein